MVATKILEGPDLTTSRKIGVKIVEAPDLTISRKVGGMICLQPDDTMCPPSRDRERKSCSLRCCDAHGFAIS